MRGMLFALRAKKGDNFFLHFLSVYDKIDTKNDPKGE